jgi:hypothetical protein
MRGGLFEHNPFGGLIGGLYLIVDRIGMTLVYDPVVKAAANLRPSGQAGWYGFWRVGADSSVAGASTALRTLSLT